jgi:hypothetical protein
MNDEPAIKVRAADPQRDFGPGNAGQGRRVLLETAHFCPNSEQND